MKRIKTANDDAYEEPAPERLAAPQTQPPDDPPTPAAVLWVPSPDNASGWQEWYVYPKIKRPKPGTLGYRPGRRRT
jgi:hypothetical protein